MRIFITGAAGFIGRRLLQALAGESHQLLLLAKDKDERKLLAAHSRSIIIADLKDIGRFKKKIISFRPQACVHLAWEGIPDYSFRMSERNLDNSSGLLNLLINETKCRKIIITGSCLEYGKTKGRCRESDGIRINSFFSWAKYTLYRYADSVCRQAKRDLIWLRLFYVYGPGQRKGSLIPGLARSFMAGLKPKPSNPLNSNDFIYVDDVAQALRIAAERKIKPGIYNLGSGGSSRVIDICKILEETICGKTSYSRRIKLDSRGRGIANFWADMRKTQRVFGWKPKTSLKDGIKNYLKQGARP